MFGSGLCVPCSRCAAASLHPLQDAVNQRICASAGRRLSPGPHDGDDDNGGDSYDGEQLSGSWAAHHSRRPPHGDGVSPPPYPLPLLPPRRFAPHDGRAAAVAAAAAPTAAAAAVPLQDVGAVGALTWRALRALRTLPAALLLHVGHLDHHEAPHAGAARAANPSGGGLAATAAVSPRAAARGPGAAADEEEEARPAGLLSQGFGAPLWPIHEPSPTVTGAERRGGAAGAFAAAVAAQASDEGLAAMEACPHCLHVPPEIATGEACHVTAVVTWPLLSPSPHGPQALDEGVGRPELHVDGGSLPALVSVSMWDCALWGLAACSERFSAGAAQQQQQQRGAGRARSQHAGAGVGNEAAAVVSGDAAAEAQHAQHSWPAPQLPLASAQVSALPHAYDLSSLASYLACPQEQTRNRSLRCC